MVSAISKEITSCRTVSGRLGKQLLDAITSGMYSDPRMAIREYVQNAADSIDQAQEQGIFANEEPRISITLDGRARIITVEDNGAGISGAAVDSRLGSLGCSDKNGTDQRGFRGIGRLGGLAYCDTVRFETRQTAREPVHVVEWSGKALRNQIAHSSGHERLSDAIRRIAFISARRANRSTDPGHFFRTRMINVHQFHTDLLMNVKGLRAYLSQTAPVAYQNNGFCYAPKIEKHLAEIRGYRSYEVTLNGAAVTRPHQLDITARDGLKDYIHDIELVECLSREGKVLCRGWFAQMGFISALPQHVTMRGIRIRQGNIAVGDEYFLRDLFTEGRFATWHIGELHVAPILKLNARRDGFEESPEYEDFLEWAMLFCRRLSALCRQSSKERCALQNKARLLDELERQLSIPFFIDERHLALYMRTAEQQLARLRRLKLSSENITQQTIISFASRLASIKDRPVFLRSILDGRTLRLKDKRQLIIDLCGRLSSINHGLWTPETILEVVKPFVRNSQAGQRA